MRWLLLIACGCGFERNDSPPRARLIAPLSTSFVATATPTLRYAMPATLSDPVVELCPTRACSGPLLHATVDATQGSAVPAQPLTPGLWYWRVRANTPMGPSISAVWQFRVVPGSSGLVWGGALDVNGDGFDELAIAAPNAPTPSVGLSDGRVYVYAGSPSGPDPAQVTVLDAPSTGNFGFVLASVDFNGDGFADLAVGAPNVAGGGAVYLYNGGPDGLAQQPTQTLTVPNASSFGWSVAGAGDFNGDGFGDLLVGAPTSFFQGQLAGTAFVFSGADHDFGVFTPLQPETGRLLQIGVAVAGGGDLDGDGLDDVLIGAPGASPGGHTWLIRGGDKSGEPLLLDVGAPADALFGYSLVVRGDTDGDGICDFAVGEPGDGPGHVYLYRGQLGGPPLKVGELDGPDGNDGRFGISLASGGDGASQLAVAANCAPSGPSSCDGRVYLNPGPAATVYAGPPDSSYGTGLALLDADGDGVAELAVGAPESANELGRVDWFQDPAVSPAPRIFNGSDATGRFGYAVH